MANIQMTQVSLFLDHIPLTKVGRDKKTIQCTQIISILRDSAFVKNRRVNWQLGEALAEHNIPDENILRDFLRFCFNNSGSAAAVLRSYHQRKKERAS